MLVDNETPTTFEEVYSAIEGESIIEWLKEKGADMSILLSETMSDEKALIVDALKKAATSRKGDELRKLGVKNNGYCLVIALALEAKAISEPITSPNTPKTTIQ